MELFRTLGALAEVPSPELAVAAEALGLGSLPSAADHSDLFVFQLYPYASVYLGVEGMVGGEGRDRISGFWRAMGQAPPEEPDHLAVLLSTYAELCERDGERPVLEKTDPGETGWRRARRAFLWEHLISWLPIFLDALSRSARHDFYRHWAGLLLEGLQEQAEILGPLDREPLCLRESPGLVDPRDEGADPWIGSLLAPCRSGWVLTRDDLRRAGRELGLAVRAGERRFVLRALMSQEPAAILAWLAEHGRCRAELPDWTGRVGAVWGQRRAESVGLLDVLAREAKADPLSEP